MNATPIVVGLSYRTAPLELLERAALAESQRARLASSLLSPSSGAVIGAGLGVGVEGACVGEAVVLSTCNRLEVYAAVNRFHDGLASIGMRMAEQCGVPLATLTPHLYVHYERSAVEHLFQVASGLDSMAVGEQQILGQVRGALREAQESGTVSRVLQPLLQQALRVGKRVHTETDLDRAGTSLVAAGLHEAARWLASTEAKGSLDSADGVGEMDSRDGVGEMDSRDGFGGLAGRSVLVLGAGAMGGLAVAGVQRSGAARLIVLSRTFERAQRLAEAASPSMPARAVPASELQKALADADVVLACTGALGHLVELADAKAAAVARGGRAQVYLDLALPRDIDPAIAQVEGVHLIDLERLGEVLAAHPMGAEIEQARQLVSAEVSDHVSALDAQQVAPTVVALRAKAREVMSAEMLRLRSRLGPDADPELVAELEQSLHRVVEKLLHTPTVRVKELAGAPNGSAYATALRELFDLDLGLPAAVTGRAFGELTDDAVEASAREAGGALRSGLAGEHSNGSAGDDGGSP